MIIRISIYLVSVYKPAFLFLAVILAKVYDS
jgi:hypothetical protein